MIDVAELLVASPWTYLVIFAIAALDAVLPVVPSETAVIAAGALAGVGDLSLTAVVAAGAAGALAGDTGAHLGGRLVGPRLRGWIDRSDARRHQRERAERLLDRRAGLLILTARFVPGGRTAVTLTSGVVRFPFRRFVLLALGAAVLWAAYAGLAGYAGGRAFEDEPLVATGAALAVVAGIGVAVESARRVRRLRARFTG